jgi:hypothetical protein
MSIEAKSAAYYQVLSIVSLIAFECSFLCELVQGLLLNKPDPLERRTGNTLNFPIQIPHNNNFFIMNLNWSLSGSQDYSFSPHTHIHTHTHTHTHTPSYKWVRIKD